MHVDIVPTKPNIGETQLPNTRMLTLLGWTHLEEGSNLQPYKGEIRLLPKVICN